MNPIRNALGHLISCKDATRAISQAQDRPLGAWERWTLRMHLSVCVACSRFKRQIDFMREALRRYRS